MRFRALATTEADGRTRLVVTRCVDGGMRVGTPALDVFPDAAQEADDLLAAAGWRRTGPWWLIASGAAAAVVPSASVERPGVVTPLAARQSDAAAG